MKGPSLLRVFITLCSLFCVLPALALDREAFTFTQYDLTVHIEPLQQRLAVRGKIILRNDSNAAQKNLTLQISSALDWRSIQFAGKSVQFVSQTYVSDIDHTGELSEAIVSLPQEVPAKASVTLDVGYEGVIPVDATRLTRIGVPEEQAKHSEWDQINPAFVAIRGAGHVVWYPVSMDAAILPEGNSVFETLGRWQSRSAQSEMKVRIVNDTNGGPQPEVRVNASKCSAFEQGAECWFAPMGWTIPTIVGARYTDLDRPNISVHYLPEHKGSAENYVLGAERTISFVTEWFGEPRGKIEVVELPDSHDAPFESGTLMYTPLSDVTVAQAEITAVHQFTHAAVPSSRLWIYEGLAHFAQAAYTERHDGRQAALDLLAKHRNAMVDAEKAVAQEQANNAGDSLINTFTEEFYRSKAAYVWWMLRDLVTEPVLKKALEGYRADQDKDPSYVQRLIAAQTNHDLEWFFDDWVYRDRGLPDFRVDSVYPRPTLQNTFLTTVTIENLGSAGAEIPVKVSFEGGEQHLRLEVHAKSKNSIRFNLPALPQEVTVNDGSVPESDLSNNGFTVQAVK